MDYLCGIKDEPDKATRDVSLYPSSGKETPNVNSLDQATLSMNTTETVNLRKAPECRYSPRVITKKWLLKN
jgi:hypothetical protein